MIGVSGNGLSFGSLCVIEIVGCGPWLSSIPGGRFNDGDLMILGASATSLRDKQLAIQQSRIPLDGDLCSDGMGMSRRL